MTKAPSPASVSASHAWLNRVTQEEEERKRRGMEEEEEGRKGARPVEEEDKSRGKKDMQDKLNKLFSQPADPWASAGGLQCECVFMSPMEINYPCKDNFCPSEDKIRLWLGAIYS